MDNQRLLVWAAFGLLAFMTYQAWLQDYGPAPAIEEMANPVDVPPAAADNEALPGLPTSDAGVPELPAGFVHCMNKMLVSNPDDRFQTPRALLKSLEPLLDVTYG